MSKALAKFDLEGKTALITGGAGLLGVEHAAALLETGATVVLTDINADSLMKAERRLRAEAGETHRLIMRTMDVCRAESIRETQQGLSGSGVHVDILVNNAAIDPKVTNDAGLVESSRLESFSVEQWDLQLNVGLRGAFLCAQVFGAVMADSGRGGVILNIASDLSVVSPDQRLYRKPHLPEHLQPVKPVTYSVIKAGLVGLTRYLATYWAEQGVRANALSPGGVFQGQAPEFVRKLSSLIPLGRMASIEEYRAAIQFMCSDASAYLNGQNIIMDGGRSVW